MGKLRSLRKQYKMISPLKRLTIKLIIIIVIVVIFGGCKYLNPLLKPATDSSVQTTTQPPIQSTPQRTKPPIQVELLAVGDNLIHEPIYNEAKEITNNKGYDFGPAYSRVEDLIKKADIAFINQETPLGGTTLGISAYPHFNSPQELGDHMAAIGFDVINHANNHILDKREAGLKATLDFWKKYKDIKVIGAYATKEDSEKIQVIEKNGIRFSFIGFTYGTNGMFLKDDSNAVVQYITDEAIITHISEARKISDIVVVSMHWGNEDQFVQSVEQKRLAGVISAAGADVIIGHHPHVIQPIQYIDKPEGGETLVVYSLGNFISGQKGAANMLGGLVSIVFEKIDNSKDPNLNLISITKVKFIPLVTHYNNKFRDLAIYPFSDYTRELASLHGCVKYDNSFSYDYLQSIITKTILPEFLK